MGARLPSRGIAEAYAGQVLTVPWTPTVEETRTLALSLCRHEWILFMDDDECLSAEAARQIRTELENPTADIYEFPLRHDILGRHDELAYDWPEHHVRLFRLGAVTFSRTVHAGIVRHADRVARFAASDGVCIHHLSHPDVSGWIEKTNRYTSRPDRVGLQAGPDGFAAFAHERIDHWMARSADDAPGGYPAAVALLRAVYDMVDAVKAWEADSGLDGTALFQQVCEGLDGASPAPRPVVSGPSFQPTLNCNCLKAGAWSDGQCLFDRRRSIAVHRGDRTILLEYSARPVAARCACEFLEAMSFFTVPNLVWRALPAQVGSWSEHLRDKQGGLGARRRGWHQRGGV